MWTCSQIQTVEGMKFQMVSMVKLKILMAEVLSMAVAMGGAMEGAVGGAVGKCLELLVSWQEMLSVAR